MLAASLKPTTTKRRRTPKRKRRRISTSTTATGLITAIRNALTSSNTFLNSHDIHLLPSQYISLYSSLSKIQSILPLLQLQGPQYSSSSSSSSCCWFERFLISSTSDDDCRWVDFFRMSKPTFYYLLNSTSSLLQETCSSISPDFALASALYRLAHNVSFSFLALRFGFSSSDACRAFYAVCKALSFHLGPQLGLGLGLSLRAGVSLGFQRRLSLIHCCGVLGVETFPIQGQLLGNNGFLSVQALVDSDGRFLDVSAGWPCTFSPYSILRQTSLFSTMEELLTPDPKVDDTFLDHYVFGDPCYPCLPWLFTPFSTPIQSEGFSSVHLEFNEVHERAMGFLRMAFRRVRANWQLLNRTWKEESIEFFPFIIITACMLNNFLMEHGEISCDNDVGCVRAQVLDMLIYDGEADVSGARNRDLLALHLSRGKDRESERHGAVT